MLWSNQTRFDQSRPDQSANLLEYISMDRAQIKLNRNRNCACDWQQERWSITSVDGTRNSISNNRHKESTMFLLHECTAGRVFNSMWRLPANVTLFLYGTYLKSRERDAECEWKNIGISVTWLVHIHTTSSQSTPSTNTTSQSVSRSGTFRLNTCPTFAFTLCDVLATLWWQHECSRIVRPCTHTFARATARRIFLSLALFHFRYSTARQPTHEIRTIQICCSLFSQRQYNLRDVRDKLHKKCAEFII